MTVKIVEAVSAAPVAPAAEPKKARKPKAKKIAAPAPAPSEGIIDAELIAAVAETAPATEPEVVAAPVETVEVAADPLSPATEAEAASVEAKPVKMKEPRILHHASEVEPFRYNGVKLNGSPGRETLNPACDADLDIGTHAAYALAFDLVLMATGPKNGCASTINPWSLHKDILDYRGKFTTTALTVWDEKVHACRAAHRLLCQAEGRKIPVSGGYASKVTINERVDALYAVLVDLAQKREYNVAEFGVPAPAVEVAAAS